MEISIKMHIKDIGYKGVGEMTGFCEDGNEPSGFLKNKELL
jgi:hypothetical protein